MILAQRLSILPRPILQTQLTPSPESIISSVPSHATGEQDGLPTCISRPVIELFLAISRKVCAQSSISVYSLSALQLLFFEGELTTFFNEAFSIIYLIDSGVYPLPYSHISLVLLSPLSHLSSQARHTQGHSPTPYPTTPATQR